MLPRPLPYQVYFLSDWSGCLPVLYCLVFAGVLVELCHGCQVCLLPRVSVVAHQRQFCVSVPYPCVIPCLFIPLPTYLV